MTGRREDGETGRRGGCSACPCRLHRHPARHPAGPLRHDVRRPGRAQECDCRRRRRPGPRPKVKLRGQLGGGLNQVAVTQRLAVWDGDGDVVGVSLGAAKWWGEMGEGAGRVSESEEEDNGIAR